MSVAPRSGPEAMLYQLKSRGPQTAATLAAACAITPMGAHKQLKALQEQGLVVCHEPVDRATEPAAAAGRPARSWALTAAGHGRFPDRHGDLAVQLIRHASELLGPAALELLISARERDSEALYLARLSACPDLGARVRVLAELRAEEGYMASAQALDGGAWLLIEDHCPICAAARSCQGFCRSELDLFRRCLGPAASVERSEHQLDGARRCAYRIVPLASTPAV